MHDKTMRFNNRELAELAQNGEYDKSGVLQVREKQEGLFRRGDVLIDRLFRLRGNLLFYFRTVDVTSEVLGVYVLERCAVELDPEETDLFSFILVFEGDERTVRFAAHTEQERDNWIAQLHIASYECLHLQLESLREQIRSKTGRDPIVSSEPAVDQDVVSNPVHGEPLLEMCIACEGLPVESNGLEPNTFAMLHCLNPANKEEPAAQQWRPHARTETFTRSSDPVYLTTIGFDDPASISVSTEVRVTVYDVKERMTNTSTQIGYVEFTLEDLLCATGCKLRLKLKQKFSYLGFVNTSNMGSSGCGSTPAPRSPDAHQVGCVTLLAWTNSDLSHAANSSQKQGLSAPMLPMKSTTRRIDQLKPLYDNPTTKTFRFPTNSGSELSVHEYMAESRMTYFLPQQLLKLWVDEERKRIEQLQELGELVGEDIREHLKDNTTYTMQRLSTYTQQEREYVNHAGAPFKPSAKRCHREVEFAPVNLHLHRVWVQSQKGRACYDATTVGAFTAFPHKFRHGGLRRMLRQLRSHVTEDADGVTRLEKVNLILARITNVKKAMKKLAEDVCCAANQADPDLLRSAIALIADKTLQLVQVCDDRLVEQGLAEFNAARASDLPSTSRPASELSNHNRPNKLNTGPHQGKRPTTSLPGSEKGWKWTGTDFVRSPTEEPWVLTRSNTEAALICVTSKCEELLADKASGFSWLSSLSPLVIKLQRCVEVMCGRARASLTFLTIRECGSNVALMHQIKYRRDVVFSQALTATASAFMTHLRYNIIDEAFLKQLVQIGVLIQFESLLSCHGDELYMMEDHIVGISDLEMAHFQFMQAEGPDDSLPIILGNSGLTKEGRYPDYLRSGYIVRIPLQENMFNLLPLELRKGHRVRITPVLFTIGINEQATLAEKFGDTSLQETVNEENYHTLHGYFEKYMDLYGEPERRGKSSLSLEQLTKHLQVNVMTKKPKNVEVLHLAAEVCRKMRGVRVVSCKSAKDRTAMAVTLECVQLLQKNHDLASHVFHHALDCLRSEGVRRENTEKNTGSRKYAFHSLQLWSFPKLYVPPSGTYGNIQS